MAFSKTIFSSIWNRAGRGCICLRRAGVARLGPARLSCRASKATTTMTCAAGHGLRGSGYSRRQNGSIHGYRTFISELDKLLPKNGFRLLDARSERDRRWRGRDLQPRQRLHS